MKGGIGNDRLDGGAGSDIAEFAGLSTDYTFNIAADGSIIATDNVTGRDGLDTIWNIENAHFSDGTFVIADLITAATPPGSGTGSTSTASYGTIGTIIAATASGTGDAVTGTAAADRCFGGSGDDIIKGLAGADRLSSGGGNDLIVGGLGYDLMTGGAGADTFEFDLVRETGWLLGSRDVITDFEHLVDKVDVHNIDGNWLVAGNQDFNFIGTQAYHRVAGELRVIVVDVAGTASDRTVIEGDNNGDGIGDFRIHLNGLITLTRADFVL